MVIQNKMTYDLVRIIRDTELSLETRPKKYSTQLELFTGRDEKVLAEFLRQERDEKPYYLRYKEWHMLVGQPEKYSSPKKFLEKQRQQMPKAEKELRDALSDNAFSKLGLSPETISVFGDLPTMLYRMYDMQTKLYESIVAYAKQIGEEEGIKPVDIVKCSEGRDEIYRRTFKTRDQFEWYNNTASHMGITVLGAIYDMMETFLPHIKRTENIPIVGWYVKQKLNKTLKKFPPKAIAELYIKDEIAYDAKKAERIYNSKQIIAREISGDNKVIDAEYI
jgi:hypothetical protein